MNAYLYILDTMADWEIGYLTAEINTGRFFDKSKPKANLIKVGSNLSPITTMGGFSINPDIAINDLLVVKGDILILPGADTWFEEKNLLVLEKVTELLEKEICVAAICGATIALAEKGLLDNRYHTSNDKEFLKMFSKNYKGEDFYIKQPAVNDKNVITASGLAPLEFTYEIFRTLDVMKASTLEAWYNLNKTKEPKYFFQLINSIEES